MSFKLYYGYHPYVSHKKNIHPHFKSKIADELIKKLRNLMTIYRKTLQYTQKLQKRVYNKGTKSKSYIFSQNIWLNINILKPNAIRS